MTTKDCNASEMFCYQCQETVGGRGCCRGGVCGKKTDVAHAQDLLVYVVKGIGLVTSLLRGDDAETLSLRRQAHRFVTEALFCTITNANFDAEDINRRTDRAILLLDRFIEECCKRDISLPVHDVLLWRGTREEYDAKARGIGVLSESDEDVRSLRELCLYGLKGLAAYLEHAARLGESDLRIGDFLLYALGQLLICRSTDRLTDLVLETGEWGIRAMALLDRVNTGAFGSPLMTEVSLKAGQRPGILVSGHDLRDLEELLEQSKDSGVDVYTHGEMLPAHYYPGLKRFAHLRGNYGNAWWEQREEFERFNGPILLTSNCLVPPIGGCAYADRVFTTGSTGYPGWRHIRTDRNGHKDFHELIERAKTCPPPTALETGSLVGGFAHAQIMALAEKIDREVEKGNIRKFVVMAGCDGRMKCRDYYRDFALALPQDCIILTAGCAKYRYIKLGLGETPGGIPRVLDAGQCNDSYSLVLTVIKLKEALGVEDVNGLPIVYNIAWYEQKAVIVLLSLLSLGIKHIHLGPTLPAFLSPHVLCVLVEKFGIGTISTPEEDLKAFGIVQ